MKKSILSSLFFVFSAIIIDQLVKGGLLYILTHGVPVFGNSWSLVPEPVIFGRITSFFNLVFTWNPGTSFSLFRSLGESAPMIIVVMTGFVIGYLGHYLLFRATDTIQKNALALIIGGALGNLIDRVRFGAVIDFLDFHIGGLHWPAFNVADICITVGVGLYIFGWIFKKNNKGK